MNARSDFTRGMYVAGFLPGTDYNIIRNMKMKSAAGSFAALGNETRLELYRLLVEAGPEGMPAGECADLLGISASNLSFHAGHLERVGLLSSHRVGRRILYSADFTTMGELVDYLTDECCGGHPEVCRPVKARGRKKSTPGKRRKSLQ